MFLFVYFLSLSVKEYFPSLYQQPTTGLCILMECFQQGKMTVYFEITPFTWYALASSQTYQQNIHQAFGNL